MFFALLAVTFVIALGVSFGVARLFERPVKQILTRIIADEIHLAWGKYMQFAIYVVGISGGVRVWQLERYITPPPTGEAEADILVLTSDRWVLEVYRTVIGTMQSVAWMLMIFFLFALLAYVVVRVFELRRPGGAS